MNQRTNESADEPLPGPMPGPVPRIAAPLLVVAPHLDDGVFSCADLLVAHPGALVGTVCTGMPPHAARLCTPWDRACGFSDAWQAMQSRRAEDRRALGLLGAQSVSMGFLDRQYGASPPIEVLAAAIADLLESHRCESVLMPLGLCHPDHDLVHRACLQVLKKRPLLCWLAYEEAPYRRFDGLVQRRLVKLAHDRWIATPVSFAVPMAAALTKRGAALRRAAVDAYTSQLHGFEALDIAEFYAQGRYWRLAGTRADSAAAAVSA